MNACNINTFEFIHVRPRAGQSINWLKL